MIAKNPVEEQLSSSGKVKFGSSLQAEIARLEGQ